MQKMKIEPSSKATYSNPWGLALVGTLVNNHTTLSQKLDAVGEHRRLDQAVDGLENAIGDSRTEPSQDSLPMILDRVGCLDNRL